MAAPNNNHIHTSARCACGTSDELGDGSGCKCMCGRLALASLLQQTSAAEQASDPHTFTQLDVSLPSFILVEAQSSFGRRKAVTARS